MTQKLLEDEKKPVEDSKVIKEFKVNKWFTLFFVLIVGVNGISVAWTTGGDN
jgi:hypothetical protein